MHKIDLKLPPNLLITVEQSDNDLVRGIPAVLQDLAQFRHLVDREFRWRETSEEVFKANVTARKTVREVNSLYWRDVASLTKCYCVSTSWRILELLEQSILLLNEDGVLGPAIIGRALIELTSTFILNGDSIRRYVEEAAGKWRVAIVVSEKLESLLLKAIYGTRLVPNDHHLSQTNVLTQIQKLSRVSAYEDVIEKYNYLCEVAHPNVTGSARFWSDVVRLEPDGTKFRFFNPHSGNNTTVHEIPQSTLWSLGWASANVMIGFRILDKCIGLINKEFPS